MRFITMATWPSNQSSPGKRSHGKFHEKHGQFTTQMSYWPLTMQVEGRVTVIILSVCMCVCSRISGKIMNTGSSKELPADFKPQGSTKIKGFFLSFLSWQSLLALPTCNMIKSHKTVFLVSSIILWTRTGGHTTRHT